MLTCSGCSHTISFDKDKQTSSTVADIISSMGFPHVGKDVSTKHKEFTDSLIDGFEFVGNDTGKVDAGQETGMLKNDMLQNSTFLRPMLEFFDDLTRINQPICGACVHKVVSECQTRGNVVQDAHERARLMLLHLQECYKDLVNLHPESSSTVDTELQNHATLLQKQQERRVALEARHAALLERQRLFEKRKVALGQVNECVGNVEKRHQRARMDTEAIRRQSLDVLRQAQEDLRATISGVDMLKKQNPLHDQACIGAEGLIGHIGGCRLGKLAEVNVDTVEIAEALGLVALLVDSIKKRLNLTRFTSASVHPNGYLSYLQRVEDGKTQTLPLYKDNTGVPVLQANKLDQALVTLAGCIQELANRAQTLGYDVSMLSKIEQDKIGGVCLRMSATKNEEWTQAMRLQLINLHCLCKYAIEHGTN